MSKSKFVGVALATFVAFAFMGCDEVKGLAASVSIEEPLVEIAYNPNTGYPYLRIQSQDNDTVIEDIIINRGNCEVWKESVYPKKLPYGERHSPSCGCRADAIIEVELIVNGGEHLTYKFK